MLHSSRADRLLGCVAQPGWFQFDSSEPGNPWAFAGCDRPVLEMSCDARTFVTTLRNSEKVVRTWDDPLAALAYLEADALALPDRNGRWAGFLSYDLGRLFENVPSFARDDFNGPLFRFSLITPQFINFEMRSRSERRWSAKPLTSTLTRGQYVQAVARCVEYVRAGDIFQVNLSQRFTTSVKRTAREIYQRIQNDAPAAYAAVLDFGDLALVSNSPELFLYVTPDRRVITRPIKGTRPRENGKDIELLNSEKDAAELNMIVDLERNDLGRVCEIGSVKVTQPRTIEAHPTVFHGVATVEGKLRPDVGFVDLLRATFPGGSITGAPKVRAMEIIEELEPVRRGPYCGAIGYLAGDGSMQFNVAIRTMIMKDGLVHVPVGGGIVADSVPEEEYEETLVKARAMFAALGVTT